MSSGFVTRSRKIVNTGAKTKAMLYHRERFADDSFRCLLFNRRGRSFLNQSGRIVNKLLKRALWFRPVALGDSPICFQERQEPAQEFGVPYGSRTRVAAVKEKRPIVIQRNLAAWIALYRI